MDKFTLKNGEVIKRHFYNGKQYSIDEEKKRVVLTPEFHSQLLGNSLWGKFGYKKVGGSSLGDVLGTNKFGSKFIASLRIMWLGMPIMDMKYINAGNVIEPKLVKVMEEVKGKPLATFDPQKYDFDLFKGVSEDIGGIPDAYLREEKKVYELKTTGEKNIDSWEKYGVPEYYKQQVSFYDYLMHHNSEKDHHYSPKIVAAFLKPEDYADPASVDLRERKIKSYDIKYNPKDVEKWIEEVKTFRKQIVHNGVSYEFDRSNRSDSESLEWLECSTPEEAKKFLVVKGYANE